MSDYFGALMRSSGVNVADAARPLPSYRDMPAERQPSDPGLGEQITTPFALDREVSAVSPSVTAAPAIHSVDATVAKDPAARPIHEQVPTAQNDAVVTSADPTTTVLAQPDSPASAASREQVTTSQPLSAQSLTRAVLRWVASDPAQVSQSLQIVTSHEQSSTARSQVLEATESAMPLPPMSRPAQEPPVRAATLSREQHATTTEPADDAPFEPIDEPIARAEPARSNHVTLLPAVPFAAPMSTHEEEVIEVSIGAVHVRVDAPPELAVSRAPATPSARAATPGQRSGLARRALRRV